MTNVDEATGLPKGYNPNSRYDRMLFAAERSGLLPEGGNLKQGDRKAVVIENRQYNLTADARESNCAVEDEAVDA